MKLLSTVKRVFARRDVRTALLVVGVFLLASQTLSAQGDLEGGAQTAADSMKRIFKIGATLIGSLGIVGGLIMAAYKFFSKKEDATWALVSAAGGAVIVTLALSLL